MTTASLRQTTWKGSQKKIKVEKDEGPSAEKKKKKKETDNGKPLSEAQAKIMAKLQKRTTDAVELLDSTLR